MRPEFTQSSPDAAHLKNQAMVDMVERNYAVVEFDPTGHVLRANDAFLTTLEYEMNDIVGAHHRTFVDQAYAASPEYSDFWAVLREGKAHSGRFPRVTKSGRTIWIQATYAPVFDKDGRVLSITKLALDITGRVVVVDGISKGLVALGKGDLTSRIHVDPKTELSELAECFNGVMDSLTAAFRVFGDVAKGVSHAANDMNNRSTSAADAALRSAASFEETSAEVELIAGSVENTSKSASDAKRETEEAAALVDSSAEAMGQALNATVEMRQSTAEMSSINDVIDSIAFQTNLWP